MKELELNIPPFTMDSDDNRHRILTMGRGQERRMSLPLVIIETLRALGDQRPTRDQLQKLSKIRRKKFIVVLKHLLETKSVERIGGGTRFDPFRYVLGEKERRR